MKYSISKTLMRTLLGASLLIGVGQAYADNGLKCTYTTSIKDTLRIVRQDRPLTLQRTDKTFSFAWSAYENYSDVRWVLKFDIVDPKFTRMAIRNVRFDDNLYITINGNTVFSRVGGGINGYDANTELKNFFVKGENTLEIHLINNIPNFARADAAFEFSEGGCEATPLPRPYIPKLPDSQRCVESLVCTQGSATQQHGGVSVDRNCWNWETKRTCFDFRDDPKTCEVTPVTGGSCEIVSKQCIDEKEFTVNGQTLTGCTLFETKTRCTKPIDVNSMTAAERAQYEADNARRAYLCKPVQTCVGDDCYIKSTERDEPDQDMPFVLALLELGRQAGTYYDPANMRLFSGIPSSCRSKRGFGLMAACCDVKSPVATDSKGQQVTPTNANTFNNVYENVEKKYDNPNTSYQDDYIQSGSNPYTYDALYKPNEANFMLQGMEAMTDTKAGQEGMSMGGASTITVMGYGYSESGTATGDQQSFTNYSNVSDAGTPND
ncbi:MAG: conjugal transfer protein TraN [Acinetobacter sp.]|nr:conjugal transfer protein TraN [Acinetobacter sp.]